MEENNLTGLSSQVLAAWIISYKLIGVNQELAQKCMEELTRRRLTGDTFNFEEYIENKLKELTPEKAVNMNEITNVMKLMRGN